MSLNATSHHAQTRYAGDKLDDLPYMEYILTYLPPGLDPQTYNHVASQYLAVSLKNVTMLGLRGNRSSLAKCKSLLGAGIEKIGNEVPHPWSMSTYASRHRSRFKV